MSPVPGFEALWHSIEEGEALERILTRAEELASRARSAQDAVGYETIRLVQRFIAALKATTADPLRWDTADFDESASFEVLVAHASPRAIACHHVMKQVLAFHYGRHAEALAAATRAEEALTIAPDAPVAGTHRFFHALTLAAVQPTLPRSRQGEHARLLDEQVRQHRLLRHGGRANASRSALLAAEIARLQNRELEATQLYEDAIRLAREHHLDHEEALASEHAGMFHTSRKFDAIAQTYLRDASASYTRWGALGKVDHLARREPRVDDATRAVDERRKAEAALASTRQELAETRAVRDLLLSILSHDLRSPISAISGLTQLVLRRDELPVDVVRRVTAIGGSAKRLNDLIGLLLDFSESQRSGALSVARTSIDLREVCSRAIAEQLTSRPEGTILLEAPGPVIGDWDPVRMTQLVSTLLSNAAHHGGASPVRVALEADEREAMLSVHSAGLPVPEATLRHLFEPLRWSDRIDAARPSSLDLALHVVREIVTAHEGTLSATSSDEAGTTSFTIRLPRATSRRS